MYAKKRRSVLCLAPLLWTVPLFCQAAPSIHDDAAYRGEATIPVLRETQTSAVAPLADLGSTAEGGHSTEQGAHGQQMFDLPAAESSAAGGNKSAAEPPVEPAIEKPRLSRPADFNREIYYRNKLEFSLNVGWLPINVPFPLDVFVGDDYNTYPLKYTLVPIFASLRWHVNGVGGPKVLRGNFDVTFTGSVTAVTRGPENHYYAYLMGIRRNFVPRNWRVAPYWDVRLGVGNIDAKGPLGVKYAQGQDITFTINMGSGVRYNLSPRYAISAGLNFMHISNLDLSESNGKPNWGVRNYGINVYGPMVGLEVQLRRHRENSEH